MPLVNALEQSGWSVFWDHRSVPVGKDWHDVIGDAIRECRSVIVAWSQHSVDSKWVREEALEGRDREALFPILLDGIPQPFGFKIIQSADFTDWNGKTDHPEFVKLESQIRRVLGSPFTQQITPQPELPPQPQVQPVSRPITVPKLSRAGLWIAGIATGATMLGAGGAYFALNGFGSVSQHPVTAVTKVAQTQPPAQSNGFEPEMVAIPAGSFMMGCKGGRDEVEGGCFDDEKPAYEATVSAFHMGKYEVTTGQYLACISAGGCPKPRWQEPNPLPFYKKLGETVTGENYPIVGVNWDNAQAFVKWLGKETGKAYRLPSETEWEYAARAGLDTAYPAGNAIGVGNANCARDLCGDDFTYAAPVGSFSPNPFGLYDMHGNVWEWVQDLDGAYPRKQDTTAAESTGNRVVRGGAWANLPRALRSAYRHKHASTHQHYTVGFRVALD